MDAHPLAFTTALIEQDELRFPSELYNRTQVDMAYNSNRIAGGRLSEEQVHHLYKTWTLTGRESLDDAAEAANHFRALSQVFRFAGTPITAEMIRLYHGTLRANTADATTDRPAVGKWKTLLSTDALWETPPPERVEEEIVGLLARFSGPMTLEEVCDFHYRFTVVDPFQDDTGRVARLLLFHQCLASGLMPFIIPASDQVTYRQALNKYREDPSLLRDTFTRYQDGYAQQFSPLLPTRNPGSDALNGGVRFQLPSPYRFPPVVLPTDLAALRGPTSGTVTLPIHVDWSTNPTYDLSDPSRLLSMYRTVVYQARSPHDIEEHLNQGILTRMWGQLALSHRVQAVWENAFPQLGGQ